LSFRKKRRAAWETPSGTVHVISLDQPADHITFKTGIDETFPVGFSPDGRWLIISSPDR